jgi:hypothetical protein
MKKLFFAAHLLMFIICSELSAQTNYYITVNQPLSLVADAGNDTSIAIGNSVQLGGNPSAQYGYGGYIYLWEPATGLNNPTLPNPVASPASTTIYLLHVTDSHGCTAESSVTVTAYIGIFELTKSQAVFIYPNPANDVITIDFVTISGLLDLEICNYLGGRLYNDKIDAEPGSRKIIDISRFGKGIFIIHLRGDDFIYQKMIVNK